MEYQFAEDMKAIREILGLTQMEFAVQLKVEQVTISRNELGKTAPSKSFLERVYRYAFRNDIDLNRLKEMLWRETLSENHKLLFHGAKSEIIGQIDVKKGRKNNDFGSGFYTGENYRQAVSFVSGFENPSVYYFDFCDSGLTAKKYEVDQDWMLTIAYYRGMLREYEEHPIIRKLIAESRNCDYIIAPIADNRMFQIIDSFLYGEITDEQSKHCLAATNLGYQYVFVSEKAVNQLKMLERCYVSDSEREYYQKQRNEDAKLGEDKVKLARIRYRGKGRYIDEILKA